MRKALGSALVCVAGVVSGCGGSTEQHREPVISEVDGMLHVQLPSWDLINAPQLRLREIYNTSASGTDVELFRVVAVRFLDDGSLVIANSGTRELLYLDDAGALRSKYGRAGSGPGEFQMITALDVDRSGALIVYDPREVRLTRFASTGNVVDTRGLSSEDAVVDLHPLSELTDGRILAVFGAVRVFGRTGESRDTVPLVAVDPSGAPWDTLGTWAAQEWANFEFPSGVTRSEVGFGRSLVYFGRGGRVALGSTDSLDVIVYDDTGRRSMRVTGWGGTREVSGADVEHWRSQLLEQRRQAPEEIRRWLSRAPYRDTHPAFQNLLVDDGGRVWIGLVPQSGEPQTWLIVGVDGRLEGQLSVPNGSRLLDASGERVAVLRRTALDEEYVVVFQVEEEH